MCLEPDGLRWDSVSYGKHIKVTTRAWDRSFARSGTEPRGAAAQYNPRISRDKIKAIELGCARGEIGKPLDVHSNSGTFYYTHDEYIGVSKGEFTLHIIVYRQSNGSVHGYPIPTSELKNKIRQARRRGRGKNG